MIFSLRNRISFHFISFHCDFVSFISFHFVSFRSLRFVSITSLCTHSFDPNITLCYKDVTIIHRTSQSFSSSCCSIPFTIELNTKSSKTDPFRMSATVRLAENSTMLCPVEALTEYRAVHPAKDGPLFTFQNRKFLTRKDINKALKVHLNLPAVSSHS